MRKVCISAVLAGVLLLAVAWGTALGYLKIHPSNPHYFQETTTGKAVLIGSVTSIVPEDATWDDSAGVAEMGKRRLSWSRVWHFCPWARTLGVFPWRFEGYYTPWGLGCTVNMDTWRTTYWKRLTDSISQANGVGTYAEVMMFDRCGLSPAAYDRYQQNPWASDNNINNLEMPTAVGNDGTPDFYYWSSKPNLKYYQERYVKKMIDETVAYPNVIYEIENEHWEANSSGWADHYGQFIKDYISTNYPSCPRLVSYSTILSWEDLDQAFDWSCIDIVSLHYGGEFDEDPSIVNPHLESRWSYNKLLNVDEFANGLESYDILREQCWTIVTSGGNFHIEDSTPPGRPFDVCENIRSFIALSGWNFINAAPQKSLITSGGGYCMKNPGVEYVCYFPTGGSKTITLSAATYNCRWWNPRTGGFHNISSFSHGGGSKTLSTPDSNDWVLHLSTSALPAKTLTSKYATTTITIDGATGDWVPGQSKIRGGDVGTGDIGVVEYDTDNACYTGGHVHDYQLLPWCATDHAVTVSSRYDSSYVYFMVRCQDDDIWYDEPTSSNYLNDCIEFYIDPGNDGGSTAISSSTSDVQLVIDANNQKNVYCTTTNYGTQVLSGVTSTVSRDLTGWSLEVRIQKSALDPDIPSTGTIGIDFVVRDNDGDNDPHFTTICSWSDPEVSTSLPTKVPNRWGKLNLESYTDSTAPSAVTGFSATAGTGQVTLNWTKPSTGDFTGTVIRYKTGSYPTSVTDGALVVDKLGSPGGGDSYVHTGLAGGVTYYYSAFAHDAALNYASAPNANAALSTPQIYWNTLANDTATLVGGRTPSIAVDTSANVHVVYMVGDHIYYRVGNAALNFGAIEQIPDPPDGPGNYNSPHLVLDANQVPHVVFQRDWQASSHQVWYTNRLGGSWKTPVEVIGNWGDERANAPKLAVGNGYAYVGVRGVREYPPWWAQGTIARVRDLDTSPYTAVRKDVGYFDPHPYVGSAGQLFLVGHPKNDGAYVTELDSYTLDPVSEQTWISTGVGSLGEGEEFAAHMDSGEVVHACGVAGGVSDGYVWYNNMTRVNQSQNSITGLNATSDWTFPDKPPTVTVDSAGTTYVCMRRHETNEGWVTRVVNNAFDTPLVFASPVVGYLAFGPQIAPTTTGGIYVAWDYAGSSYVRSVGKGSDTPDATPPGDVSSFTATAGTGQVALTWTNPTDSDYTGVMIRYKTSGYPTSTVDGTLAVDDPGSPSQSDGYTHTGLTPGVTYYYKAFAHDSVPNYASGVTASATPTAPTLSTINTKSAANMNLVIDGATSDWSLGDFTTKSRGGQNEVGDYAIVGFDGATCYYGGYWTGAVLPTSASDHTAKVYSRHSQEYLYFLVRCDDAGMCYANPASSNWANDCIEFYIDPGHDHGSTSISSSVSDLQLVIDCNNQKNVYMTTSGYATQVLSGVTSAVVRDGTGWWLEVKILKAALDPDLPGNGSLGVDFAFRDNDNYDGDPIYGESAYSTMYGWRDSPSDTSYPHKVPDKWGNGSLATLAADTTAPAPVTGFSATPGSNQNQLSWTNPQTADWTGTMIRCKTGGYPTGPTDGTLVYDNVGTNYTHTGLTTGVTYYYCAYAYDFVPNYATAAQTSGTPTSPTVSTVNTKSAANMNLVIDGATSDWSLGDFSTKSLGGLNQVGDYAVVGFDGGTCYRGGYWTDGVLPTSATDHTAKVYSRHDQQYMCFLVRCDDDQMNYANATSTNWANDCVEFYIDPGHNHGSTSISSSTSDLQLVIDCNNQRNVYMTTSGYATQVLNGVTSAVVRDGTGWWLEVRILKSAVDPDVPASGSFGVDFCFRDNDNPDSTYYAGNPSYSTMYSWRDNPSGTGFPTKVPDVWGDASLATLTADTTAPASVTSFTATPGSGQVALAWANPSTHDWIGTMIRFKTTGYPTGPSDGTQCYNSTGTSYTHTGLTNGTIYYYCAYAYDDVPNYATAAQASATPTGGTAYDADFISDTIPLSVVKSHQYDVQVTMKNTGTNTWTKATDYKLGAVGDSDPFNSSGRVLLDDADSIATNDQKTFNIWFTAPSSTGTYTTDWRMLREYVTWFGDTDAVTVQVKDGVSINLGSSNINNNMTCDNDGDGHNTATTQGGLSCRRNTDPNDDYYFYFAVSDSWAYQGSKSDVYIKLNYYDSSGGSITLQYDATDNAFKSGGSVSLTGTNTWKTYTWHVTDAYFGNRTNGADMRFFIGTGVTRYFDQVQVSTGSL